jgi:Polyketide cyclase / dehydrase and lipid transport
MKTHFGAERRIDAPAAVVYHCLADYREHHRPGGFLPPAFEQLEIARGGVGAGTEYSLVMDVGGRRRAVVTTVSEPLPGHTLVETGSGIETTFTVEPMSGGARVRFETIFDEGGVRGILNRLFAARLLLPIYEDELRRLEEHAKSHPPIFS